MTTQQLAISVVAAARRPPDILRRSLDVLNQVRPGYYAVILGPTARRLTIGDCPEGSTVVTNDDQIEGDYLRIHGNRFETGHLTPNKPGVNVHWYSLRLQDIRKAIPNKEDRLYIKPDGLWVE